MPSAARCIAVDWGTTSLRATLMGADGVPLDSRAAPNGILAVEDGAFEAALDDVCGHWRAAYAGIPVLMSGMIGAQQGWVEAPYLETPCDLDALINAMITVPGTDGQVRIMPGVRGRTADGTPEIMRGEETQIGGIIVGEGITDGVFCIPGTHSKWINVSGGLITGFATFMTGEVFAVMKDHSILGRLMGGSGGDRGGDADAFHADAFARGLARAEAPGGLLHRLFSARTMGILDEMPKPQLASFLSGQLIGAEIRGAQELFGDVTGVHLLSAGPVSAPYAQAFDTAGIATHAWDAEAAALAGLWAAAQTLHRS